MGSRSESRNQEINEPEDVLAKDFGLFGIRQTEFGGQIEDLQFDNVLLKLKNSYRNHSPNVKNWIKVNLIEYKPN